jgi:hypothetical protein
MLIARVGEFIEHPERHHGFQPSIRLDGAERTFRSKPGNGSPYADSFSAM